MSSSAQNGENKNAREGIETFMMSRDLRITTRYGENKNAREGIETLLPFLLVVISDMEKTKMPARALRHATFWLVAVGDVDGENKNAREGIETPPPSPLGWDNHQMEKTKMPARALGIEDC